MTMADVIGVLAFLGLVLLGLFVMTIQSALKQRPSGRVRSRLDDVMQRTKSPTQLDIQRSMAAMQRAARRRQRHQAMGLLGKHLMRIDIVSGQRGMVILVATGVVMAIISSVVAALFLPVAAPTKLLVIVGITALSVSMMYRRLVQRFRQSFLDQLPDVIDMIIRGSQAGIPVPQTLRNVGREFTWPAGPEFQRMGDRLQLGHDMEEVLDDAEQRIELPDFSFLSVTLLLQRETGGSLSETLANLANVVRARRDLRLKTRALTAEGRMSANIISALPFFILLFMVWANPEYIAVLFDTEAGRKLLMVAGAMLLLGILLIRKIARLET